MNIYNTKKKRFSDNQVFMRKILSYVGTKILRKFKPFYDTNFRNVILVNRFVKSRIFVINHFKNHTSWQNLGGGIKCTKIVYIIMCNNTIKSMLFIIIPENIDCQKKKIIRTCPDSSVKNREDIVNLKKNEIIFQFW